MYLMYFIKSTFSYPHKTQIKCPVILLQHAYCRYVIILVVSCFYKSIKLKVAFLHTGGCYFINFIASNWLNKPQLLTTVYEPRHEKTRFLHMQKQKAQISYTVLHS